VGPDRHQPDDGSPTRLIATMVGIVGILLLGSLFWSAVGAMVNALGEATQAFPIGKPAATRMPTPVGVAVAEAPDAPSPTPTRLGSTPTSTSTAGVATAVPTVAPTAAVTSTPAASPTPEASPTASGRAPWVLLPQPAPDSKVKPGATIIEARGRGDAPISEIRLELDGQGLPAGLEQRSDSVWRAAASTEVGPGKHTARAVVTDESGRSGAFRWSFEVVEP
jgi:hypothetical protein